jgi:hypothetical protein
MKRILLPLLALLVGLSVGPDATAGRHHAHQVRYVGVHPIPKKYGGGFCHIRYPHVHVYAAPDAKRDYRKHGDDLYYVGDPVAHGWDGPRYAYYGPHPVRVDAVVGEGPEDTVYCYIKGPHYHVYAPAPVVSADFELKDGAYWYVGDPPEVFVHPPPVMAEVNAYYEPIHYDRPVVEVDAAPVGWIGARVDLVGPAVEVHTPVVVEPTPVVVEPGIRAHVDVGLPSLSVHVGGPAIVVGDRPGVIVVDHRHHHDNGRHRGWYKHERRRDHRVRVRTRDHRH